MKVLIWAISDFVCEYSGNKSCIFIEITYGSTDTAV